MRGKVEHAAFVSKIVDESYLENCTVYTKLVLIGKKHCDVSQVHHCDRTLITDISQICSNEQRQYLGSEVGNKYLDNKSELSNGQIVSEGTAQVDYGS